MDEFENELRAMMRDRVSGLPADHDASMPLLERARRRRTKKLTALVASMAVVAVGIGGVVARSAGNDGPRRVVTSTPTSAAPPPTTTTVPASTTVPTGAATTTVPASVPTVACPATYALTGGAQLPAPATAPRVPPAGDRALLPGLASFAASTDPRYVVLGPNTWSCQAAIAADGQNGMVVYPTASPPAAAPAVHAAPIAIINDWLWHGDVGSTMACTVFDDPALVAYVRQTFPNRSCPEAGRSVTRLSPHVSTFVDGDGARGVGWIDVPSSTSADDGKYSILTCRPTDGLTAADCDTIVLDYATRLDPSL